MEENIPLQQQGQIGTRWGTGIWLSHWWQPLAQRTGDSVIEPLSPKLLQAARSADARPTDDD